MIGKDRILYHDVEDDGGNGDSSYQITDDDDVSASVN